MSISIALISPWNLFLECPNSLPRTLVVLTEKVLVFCWFHEQPCDGRGWTVKGRAGTWDPVGRLGGAGQPPLASSWALGPCVVTGVANVQEQMHGDAQGKAADAAGRGFPVVAPSGCMGAGPSPHPCHLG